MSNTTQFNCHNKWVVEIDTNDDLMVSGVSFRKTEGKGTTKLNCVNAYCELVRSNDIEKCLTLSIEEDINPLITSYICLKFLIEEEGQDFMSRLDNFLSFEIINRHEFEAKLISLMGEELYTYFDCLKCENLIRIVKIVLALTRKITVV